MTAPERDPLERELHEGLRRLPVRRAPRSLAPRIRAALRARQAEPWYTRPIDTWPLPARAAGVASLALAALLLMLATPLAGPLLDVVGMPAASATAWGWTHGVPQGLRGVVEDASAMVLVWRVLLAPMVGYAAMVAVVTGGVFAVCAAALTRVVLGRTPA